jgi:hypothetical protein
MAEKKKRGPGRPPGSRNKSKGRELGDAARVRAIATGGNAAVPAVATSPSPPTDAASLLAYQHSRLAEIKEDIVAARENVLTLPKDIAALRASEAVTLRAITDLTGATRITEAKIISSEAWRVMFSQLVMVLSKHPAAVDDLRAYLESLEE